MSCGSIVPIYRYPSMYSEYLLLITVPLVEHPVDRPVVKVSLPVVVSVESVDVI
jgi:hypothetical protein